MHEGNRARAHCPGAAGCGVRLQEPLQGTRVQLTLAVHDGDGYGSEDQEAGASHSNPEENITDGILCYFLACSCRKKGENEERPGMSADGIPSFGLLVLALCWGAEGGHVARRLASMWHIIWHACDF